MTTAQPSGIVTPEAVLLEFDTAGVGSRTIAEILDLLVQLTALVALSFVLSFAVTGGLDLGQTLAVVVTLVLTFLILVGYPIAMETLWNGRTLGKAAMGLRVVTQEGGPIRFRHAAIRGIFGLIEIWVFLGSIALVAIIFSKRNQRVGDIVAGTIVLRERSAASPGVAVSFPPPPGYEAYVGSLDVTPISAEQYSVIRGFLMRVFELSPPARMTLAIRLANPTAVLMHHTPPPAVSPELFLVCVAAAYQQRHGGPSATLGPAALAPFGPQVGPPRPPAGWQGVS
jgi:uncharacterized RDD family membrane protein YckC